MNLGFRSGWGERKHAQYDLLLEAHLMMEHYTRMTGKTQIVRVLHVE